MSTRERLADLSAVRDRLRDDLFALDAVLRQMQGEVASEERIARRSELGAVWGAVKLGRYLGVSENTARKLMRGELAEIAWKDAEGRLRVNADDVQRWITQRAVTQPGGVA